MSLSEGGAPALFEKRLERARALQRERRGLTDEEQPEQQLSEQIEKGDMFAMLLSSLLTLFLPAVLVLLALALFVCFLFGVF